MDTTEKKDRKTEERETVTQAFYDIKGSKTDRTG